MENIRSLTGGFRRKLDDLLLLQGNIKAAIAAIRALLPSAYSGVILEGITPVVSAGTLSWAAGKVLIGDEIYTVNAGSTTYNAALSYYFQVNSSLSHPRTKLNGITEEHWDNRTASVVSGASAPSGSVSLFSDPFSQVGIPDFKVLDQADIAPLFSVSGISAWAFAGGGLPLGYAARKNKILYRKMGNRLEIGGLIDILSTATTATTTTSALLKLPAGCFIHPNYGGIATGSVLTIGGSAQAFVLSPFANSDELTLSWDNPIPTTVQMRFLLPQITLPLL